MAQKLNIKAALMTAGANGAGAVAAAKINDVKVIGAMKPVIRGLLKLGIGAFLPSLLGKWKKSAIVEDGVAGWNGVAAIEIANGLITKNGTVNLDKKIAIGAAGDYDSGILGTDDVDAEYVMSTQSDNVGAADEDVV